MKRATAALLILLLVLPAMAVTKPDPVVYYPATRPAGTPGATTRPAATAGTAPAGAPVPVAVWLHGYRAFPSLLADKEYFQQAADRLQVAIVGIAGTTLLDDGTPVWSEEPAADHHYIQEVLARLAKKYPLDTGRVALFGFSEGAMVAGNLCALYPKSYRGALLMSPGGITEPKAESAARDACKGQIIFAMCGAKEHPTNVQWTRSYAQVLKRLGATVTLKEYPGQDKHTRPEDFKTQFPIWMSAILGLPEPAKAP